MKNIWVLKQLTMAQNFEFWAFIVILYYNQKTNKMAKEHTIKKTRKGRETLVTGDLERMKSYFGYTLECGASWNRKINQNPKTIKSFVKNLQMSYEETEGACYERTSIELI